MGTHYIARWAPQGDNIDGAWVYEVRDRESTSTHWVNLFSKTCTCMVFQQMGETCRHVFAIYGTRPFLPRPPFAPSYHNLVGSHYLTSTHLEMYVSVPIIPDMRNLAIDADMAAPPAKYGYPATATNAKRRRNNSSFFLEEEMECSYDVSNGTEGMVDGSNLQYLLQQEQTAAATLCRLSSGRWDRGYVVPHPTIADERINLPNRPVGAPVIRRYENSGLNC